MLELPTTQMTQKEFDAVLEYSSSIPTGTDLGKKWKRRCTDGWVMGEYYDIGSTTEVGIRWSTIKIVPETMEQANV